MQAINKDTVSSAALALLAYLESNLQDLERLLSTMKNSQGRAANYLPIPGAFMPASTHALAGKKSA